MAKLEVEIGADIKDLQSKVNSATKDLKDFGNDSKKNLGNFSKSANTANKSISNMSKGVANGSSAMTAFSRTIQDAPFGLMGVSNNITNLTEQFGYLKKRTGSAGGALKAMLRDLKGFGGISLAISLATSLMLVFGDKIFATKDKVKQLKKEQEDLTNSLENYALGLEAVNKANLKGVQSAQKELVTFKLLSEQVNNSNLSLNKRKDAIEELRKKYPDYLSKMSDEKLLNGGLATVYDTLTTSINKRAKATASMNAIIKNSETLLNIESQLAAEKTRAAELDIKAKQKEATAMSIVSQNLKGQETALREAKRARDEYNDSISKTQQLLGQKQNLELTNIDLEANVSDLGGIAKTIIPDGTADEIRTKVQALGIGLKNDLKGVQDVVNEKPLQIINDKTLSEFEVNQILLKERLKVFTAEVNEMLSFAKENGVINFGSAIGSAIANGTSVIKGAGASLLSTLGSLMVKYGSLVVKFGLAKEALSKSLKNPFGGGIGAVIAGGALVAIGSALKGFSANVSSGGGFGGSNATAGGGASSNNSFSSGFSGGYANNQRVEFVIRGESLYGVLDNYMSRNSNLGGSLRTI